MSAGEEEQQVDGAPPAAARPPATALPASAALPASPVLPTELAIAGGATQAPRVPGAAGERFQRFPTGMVDLPASAGMTTSGATVGGDEPHVAEWATTPVPAASTYRGFAGWGLGFSIAGLAVSFVVGWGFPIALVGLVTGAFALRRPTESRAIAGWALALGITGLVYSVGWLVYAATSANLFG